MAGFSGRIVIGGGIRLSPTAINLRLPSIPMFRLFPTTKTLLGFLACFLVALSGRAQSNYTTPYFFPRPLPGFPASAATMGMAQAPVSSSPVALRLIPPAIFYVADSDNDTSSGKISKNGGVITLAGLAGHAGNADGPGSIARFDFSQQPRRGRHRYHLRGRCQQPRDPPDQSRRNRHDLRRAGGNEGKRRRHGQCGSRFNRPEGLAIDAGGTLYVADAGNELIGKFRQPARFTTVAGSAGVVGGIDGAANVATFSVPFPHRRRPQWRALRVGSWCPQHSQDHAGGHGHEDLQRIYSILRPGKVSTNSPAGLVVSSRGTVIFADRETCAVYELDSSRVTINQAGGGNLNAFGGQDGTGSTAQFNNPTGLTADAAGNLYVADTSNNTRFRKISPTWTVTTVAGVANVPGSTDGTGSVARFFWPNATAVDNAGNVYVSDFLNDTIRKISPAGSSDNPCWAHRLRRRHRHLGRGHCWFRRRYRKCCEVLFPQRGGRGRFSQCLCGRFDQRYDS